MFKPSPEATGEPFTISMPPPNVTGALHMGHAMFVTLEDIMIRYARMCGRPTLWVPGTDHAGIATQLVVERMLSEEGVTRAELGREAFLERVWTWKQEYGSRITQQIRRLGASCDWSRESFTLSDSLSDSVKEAFCRLHSKGLVYRGTYMVNWSPHLQTAVSDLEVEYSDENGHLYFFQYPVESGEGFLPVATTRPETILGDTAVAVHPEDERYKQFVGKRCVVPRSGGRTIPIIADEYVDMEFGTGALKITPGHDVNDYDIGKRVGLPIINIMNKDGTLNARAGEYAGMDRFDCRKQLWADMQADGIAIKREEYKNRVPRSQRGGEVIEPLVSAQWFVKMKPLAEPALKAVDDGKLKIVPARFEKIYRYWLDDIKDWCISRQLWWGHRIPVYYVHPSKEAAEAALANDGDGSSETFVVAKSEEEAYVQARAAHGAEVVLVQDKDVLDTWFSSGLWPFSTLGWPNEESPDLKKFYPTQVMETGHDILFFWVARMVMMGIEFTGELPFHTIFLHGLVRDEKGRKMSKSVGNVVDPLVVIDEIGTDPLRFTLATGTTPGQDLNLSMDRLRSNRNFVNKIWNGGKFILFNLAETEQAELEELSRVSFTEAQIKDLPLAERWIISKLHTLVDTVDTAFARYDFGAAGSAAYDFFWNEFADWYIEASKSRMYGDDAALAQQTRRVLVYVFDRSLRVLHPFMPFVTEELWQAIPHTGESISTSAWPAGNQFVDHEAVNNFDALQMLVRSIRNVRAEYNVELGRKIPGTVIASPAFRQALEQEGSIVAKLASLDDSQLTVVGSDSEFDSSAEGVRTVVRDGLEVFLPLAGLADPEKEIGRLSKQAEKLEKTIQGLAGRLSSPKFVEKAPEKVVQGVRDEMGEAEEQLKMVNERKAQMEALLVASK